jgi:hypothetical protein
MTSAETTLGIDLWHTRLAAALHTPDGRITPLAIDGAVVIPTGVAVADDGTLHTAMAGALLGRHYPHSYIRIPGQRLYDEHITVGELQVNPVDVIAAVLSTVAHAAGQSPAPTRLVIATPAGWTTRQHARLRAAAAQAGLGQPALISGAEAIIRHHADSLRLTAGQVVAVLRLDNTVGEVALLRYEPDGCRRVAAVDCGELGEVPGATVVGQAATALADALDACGLTGAQLAAVLCDAPPSVVPSLAAALTATVGTAPAPVPVGELAAALGAARRTGFAKPAPVRRSGWGLVRAGVSGTASFAVAGVLTVQQMTSGTIYEGNEPGQTVLVLEWYGWGLAPIFAMLGVVAFACLATDLRAILGRAAPTGPAPGLGAGLFTAAVTGVIVATVLALLGAATYGVAAAPLLRWALVSTTPLAVILVTLGVAVTRSTPPAGRAWPDLLQPPTTAVLVGGTSTVVLVATYRAVPRIDSDLWWTTEHLAAFGLGWAIALLLTADLWRRLLLGAALSTATTYAIDITTATAIATGLIIAVTVWAALRLARAMSSTLGRHTDPATATAPTSPVAS